MEATFVFVEVFTPPEPRYWHFQHDRERFRRKHNIGFHLIDNIDGAFRVLLDFQHSRILEPLLVAINRKFEDFTTLHGCYEGANENSLLH